MIKPKFWNWYHIIIRDKVKLFPCKQRILSSADNLCKQFGSRSRLTDCRSWSGSKLFDTLIVFLRKLGEDNQNMNNYPACNCSSKSLFCILMEKDETKWCKQLQLLTIVITKFERKLYIDHWDCQHLWKSCIFLIPVCISLYHWATAHLISNCTLFSDNLKKGTI